MGELADAPWSSSDAAVTQLRKMWTTWTRTFGRRRKIVERDGGFSKYDKSPVVALGQGFFHSVIKEEKQEIGATTKRSSQFLFYQQTAY